MTRTSLADHPCSIARTVDLVGDQWILLILRDAFYGLRSFSAFQASLGIAKTVLSDRLQRLVAAGILDRVQSKAGIERFEYRLTDKGRDLFPVVIGLMQWGDRWIFGPDNAPVTMVDRMSNQRVQPVVVHSADGQILGPEDVSVAGSQPPASR